MTCCNFHMRAQYTNIPHYDTPHYTHTYNTVHTLCIPPWFMCSQLKLPQLQSRVFLFLFITVHFAHLALHMNALPAKDNKRLFHIFHLSSDHRCITVYTVSQNIHSLSVSFRREVSKEYKRSSFLHFIHFRGYHFADKVAHLARVT